METARAADKIRKKLELDLAAYQGRELYQNTVPGPDGVRRAVDRVSNPCSICGERIGPALQQRSQQSRQHALQVDISLKEVSATAVRLHSHRQTTQT